MTNTELYINGILVDVSRSFGIRLNRQLLNPGELNTKDAQYSYNISLPPTQTNHRAFNYSQVEETRDKFNREYDAELIINSVRIFRGKFRLSNIERDGYKGNLYIPAKKSVKDIFGEIKLNENPEYRIPFSNFATSINSYNASAANGPQIAMFPYVMYGVLPKVPINKDENTYSARTLWDDSVRMGMQDLAPSINPLLMLRHIFQQQGYTLQGNAFDDQKLINLYMSYKNADDYVQPWNYGQQAKMQVSGYWGSTINQRTTLDQLERGVNQGSDPTGGVYACDFLNATNTRLDILEDNGGNIQYKEVNDNDGVTWVQGQIRIPTSGFYKVKLFANLWVFNSNNWRQTDPSTGVQHISGLSTNSDNSLVWNAYEIRLCRDRKGADFNLNSPALNNQYYYNNQPQNTIFDENNAPKYFPPSTVDGDINLVDLAQDRSQLLGFCFGSPFDSTAPEVIPQYRNPLDEGYRATILAAKPAVSWMASANNISPTRLAIKAPGYTKYGAVGDFDNPGDNPDSNIDYSAGPFANGQVLDANGNAVPPSPGNLTSRTNGYSINLATGFIGATSGWQVSDYIDVRVWEDLAFSSVVTDAPDTSIVAMYDAGFQFIGSLIDGPAIGDTDTYTNEPITPDPLCAYVRLSGMLANPMVITGTDVSDSNIILNRFPIERYYTYHISTPGGSGYTGTIFIHDGASTAPISRVPVINGAATFDTGFAPMPGTLDLKLTLYLKTPAFDVNGTLVLSREIKPGSEVVIGWEATNKYKIDLDNAPANYARRGQYNGLPVDPSWYGEGEASAVVWLDAGELLTVASVSSDGRYRENGMHSTFGWVAHAVTFNLSVQPFRTDPEWLKVSLAGNGTAHMDWNDSPNFDVDSIDLVGFLSADIKTDDFIDNFCKAFNLRLSQINATTFALDVKQNKASISNRYIDLDGIASVSDRENTPLGLPSTYKLGFTVDVDEEGYVQSGDDGGGSFDTGVTESNVVEQKSFFSYNWFKQITKTETAGNVVIPLPIISKSDVWNPAVSYPEAMRKKYTNQAYRFWYYDGLLNDLGASFEFNGISLDIAKVSNEIAGLSILNYKNEQYTILDNYFTLLINGASHYTEVQGFVTALQYQYLDGTIYAMFNGDLYFVAELSAYDPTGRNKTTIKLIRKI